MSQQAHPAVVNFAREKHAVELRDVAEPDIGPEDVLLEVQAVGGLTIKQAIECPAHGAALVVLGAPLVIAANDFKPSGSDLGSILREICTEIRKTPMPARITR